MAIWAASAQLSTATSALAAQIANGPTLAYGSVKRLLVSTYHNTLESQMDLEGSEIAAAAMTARLKLPDIEAKNKPKRRPIPDHIPRMEVELTPGADACADCGGRLRRIGEDVTEELEYVPGRFIVNRIVRPRMACSGCDCFTQAPLPSRPIERGRPGPGLLAHVLPLGD